MEKGGGNPPPFVLRAKIGYPILVQTALVWV